MIMIDKTNAIKYLNELSLRATKERCPSVPMYALPKPNYSDKTANGLTKCIIDFVNLRGGFAERISCEGRVIDQRTTFTDVAGRYKTIGGIKRIKTSAQIGTADISATIGGRSVKVEVKIGNDRQSEVQKTYQQQIERAGALYFIAKDFQSFFDWFNLNFESHE